MICTFYSYKHGVGRTMAVANVAVLLREAGLRVLLVDLDLEGPSLNRYFPGQGRPDRQPGFIDLVLAYKEALLDPGLPQRTASQGLPLDLQTFLLADPSGPLTLDGKLFVMCTGRLDDDYLTRIQGLDWRDFYAHWEGELFFRWLRQECSRHFDVTLVEVGGGITPAGSIGCYQLADAVIGFCAPRQRDMQGLRAFIKGLQRPEVTERRGGHPLSVLVVPSRVDDAEAHRLDVVRDVFDSTFSSTTPAAVSIDDLWRAKIPNIPFFANQDAVLVEPRSVPGERLREAYRRVADLLCRIAPPGSRLAVARSALGASG